jgi:hypothetical protein
VSTSDNITRKLVHDLHIDCMNRTAPHIEADNGHAFVSYDLGLYVEKLHGVHKVRETEVFRRQSYTHVINTIPCSVNNIINMPCANCSNARSHRHRQHPLK